MLKNIVLLVDYSLPKSLLENFYIKLKEEFKTPNFTFLDWDFLFDESFEISFTNIENKIREKLNDNEYYAFIGIGLGATILNLISNNYDIKYQIYFSPIFSKNYINPYSYFISTYKIDKKSYYERCFKEFFYFDKLFGDINSFEFRSLYNWFIINENKITGLINYISLIDQLNYLKKQEININKNSLLILSEYDLIINYSDTIKYIKKLNNKNNKQIRFKTFNNVKHWMIIESFDDFKNIIKEELKINE